MREKDEIETYTESWISDFSDLPLSLINTPSLSYSSLGLMNMHIPEQYGGLGMGSVDACIVGTHQVCSEPPPTPCLTLLLHLLLLPPPM